MVKTGEKTEFDENIDFFQNLNFKDLAPICKEDRLPDIQSSSSSSNVVWYFTDPGRPKVKFF